MPYLLCLIFKVPFTYWYWILTTTYPPLIIVCCWYFADFIITITLCLLPLLPLPPCVLTFMPHYIMTLTPIVPLFYYTLPIVPCVFSVLLFDDTCMYSHTLGPFHTYMVIITLSIPTIIILDFNTFYLLLHSLFVHLPLFLLIPQTWFACLRITYRCLPTFYSVPSTLCCVVDATLLDLIPVLDTFIDAGSTTQLIILCHSDVVWDLPVYLVLTFVAAFVYLGLPAQTAVSA